MSTKDDKRMQSINSVEKYVHGTNEEIIRKKEKIKCSNIIKQKNDITKGNIKEHNPNCLQIPDHSYRILIFGGFGSGKTNALPNLISHKLYTAMDPFEAKTENFN